MGRGATRRAFGCALVAWLSLGRALARASGLSAEAGQLHEWVLRTRDHQARPFAIVDKRQARLHVFDALGRHVASTSALLGSTFGDHIVPGVGERAQTRTVRDDERTTPAGRFSSYPGANLSGEHVVWVDYESAFAIHRLRPGRSYKFREERLASARAADKRVSEGCVVVPVAFYEQVVEPVLGRGRSVVYVMPETRGLGELFAVNGA